MRPRTPTLSSLILLAGCASARLPATPPQATAHAALAPVQVAASGGPVEVFADPERRAKLAATFPALEAFLAAQQVAQKLPSLAFGVVIDGELAYTKGLGTLDADGRVPVDADTIYRIGSITKTFTTLAILKLRDEGKLALDEPAARTLPELAALKYPTADSPPLTLRHLLTHTSGLPTLGAFNYAQSDHDVTEAEMLAGLPPSLMSPPGTRYSYSNLGFALLGLVVERVARVRYRDYVNAEVFVPLRMAQSRWSRDDVAPTHLATAYQRTPLGPRAVAHWRLGASEAAGGIYSSVRDLSRYVAFQLAAYPPRDDADVGPLRRSSRRESHVLQRLTGLTVSTRTTGETIEPVVEANVGGAGLGWHGSRTCRFEQTVGHAGGTEGYSTSIEMLPQSGVGVIALTNVQDADATEIAKGALEILADGGGLAKRTMMAGAALKRAVSRIVGLNASFSEAEYADIFAPTFRGAVPAALARQIVGSLAIAHGRCGLAGGPDVTTLSVESPSKGTFSVACERGRFELRVGVGGEGKVVDALVTSHDLPPTTRMRELATRVAALSEKGWNEATYTEVLAPTFTREAIQSALRSSKARYGACHLAKPLDGDGDHEATFALSCERGGELKMELTTDEARARVVKLRIETAGKKGEGCGGS